MDETTRYRKKKKKNPKNSQDEYGSNLKIKTSEKGNNKQPTSIRTR